MNSIRTVASWFRQLCLLFVVCFALLGSFALAQANSDPKITIDEAPLGADQLAIYRVILHGWMDNGKSPVHLALQTVPIENETSDKDARCDKHLVMEKIAPGRVHQFRAENLASLGSDKIKLVDPEKQEHEVEENDPGKKIGDGQSIDDAVSNGFTHGLVSLGEIHFDRSHTHAIVWFGFHCGSLCGNGGTVVMRKGKNGWIIASRCSIWMSSDSHHGERELGL